MNILNSVVRQDTFIIESTESDSVSESCCLQHGNIVVPVIEDQPASCCQIGLHPKNKSSPSAETKDSFDRRNITNDVKAAVTKPNKTLDQPTVPSKTHFFRNSDFFILSSSIRKKLGRDQQTKIASADILNSAEQNKEGTVSVERLNCSDSRTVPPDHHSSTIWPESNLVDNSKLIQTLAPKSNSEVFTDSSPLEKVKESLQAYPKISRPGHSSSSAITVASETSVQAHLYVVDSNSAKPNTVPTKHKTFLSHRHSSTHSQFAHVKTQTCTSLRQAPKKETSNRLTRNTAEHFNNLTEKELTPRMAKSNRYDGPQERFEDVVKERDDMMNSERVYRKRIRQLEEELKGMVSQCQALSDENKELRKTLDGIKKIGQHSENLDAKISKLELENANLAAEHKAQSKQMDCVLSENARFKNVNIELEKEIRELEKQKISLQNESAKINDLQTAISVTQDENKILKDKAKSLELLIENLEHSLQNKRQEIDELTHSLQTQNIKEANLKEAQEVLERTLEKNTQMKQEIIELKKMLTDSETRKQELHEKVAEGNNKIDMLNVDIGKKDTLIKDLRSNLDINRNELLKLEDFQKTSKGVEDSLKVENNRLGSENQKLKQNREDMMLTIEKLRQENSAELGNEKVKYLQNWEQEKVRRVRSEADLLKKEEEVRSLEARLREAENKVTELGRRIKLFENKADHLGKSGLDELENDNKLLKDGNMKLRQMLVERNIELTNTKHEQSLADSVIRNLELKQKRAEVRVHRLSQRIANASQNVGQNNTSFDTTKVLATANGRNIPLESTKHQSMKLSRPQEHQEYPGRHLQTVGPLQTTYPGPHLRRNNLQRGSSLEKPNKMDGETFHENIASLSHLDPLEPKSDNSSQNPSGYFALYRIKKKRFKEK